jgi:hypothetical protein
MAINRFLSPSPKSKRKSYFHGLSYTHLFGPKKPGPLGQVRDRWLCRGSFVSKITNYKHQITNKSQIPIFNDQNLPEQDIVWIFEFWSLEFV